MPASDDDDRPKKKIVHEIGQDLALLSIRELEERIALLERGNRRGCRRRSQASRGRAAWPISSSRSRQCRCEAGAARGDRHLAGITAKLKALLSFRDHY